MKKLLLLLALSVSMQFLSAQDNDQVRLKRIATMNGVLSSGGIKQLLAESRSHSWTAPYMPSQWHVDHMSTPVLRPLHVAARDFGRNLAVELESEAVLMQRLQVGKQLYDETNQLLDLHSWVAETEGYGNLLVALRALDLVAVGVARLSADLTFPLEKIDGLVARIGSDKLDIRACCRVLNMDAGADIFLTSDREELSRIYGSGHRLLEEKKNPSLFERRQRASGVLGVLETQVIRDNLSFFDDPDHAELSPDTLLSNWNKKRHIMFVVGLDLENTRKARALAVFRRAVGDFPRSVKYTPEEVRERELRTKQMETAGMKVTKFEDTYASPMEAAFAWAWKNHLESESTKAVDQSPYHQNLYADAFLAYKEVSQGTFLDRDSKAAATGR